MVKTAVILEEFRELREDEEGEFHPPTVFLIMALVVGVWRLALGVHWLLTNEVG